MNAAGAEGLPALVDSHAHLQDPILRDDLDGVLCRAKAAGVVQVVAIGTTADDSREVVAIAGRFPGVHSAVGVQPNQVAHAAPLDWERIVALAESPRVVAIGESGLDRYWNYTPFELQQEWFALHLALAEERGLPVVIHCRDCEHDIIAQLARLGRPARGVLHSFSGSWDDAQAFLDLGLHISFAGMVTFTNKRLDSLRDVAARVPVDRILVETDSPYLSPHPFRGQTNEPARVAVTAGCIARERGMTLSEFAAAATANARRLFNLPDTEPVDSRQDDPPES
jgi:TatD DNase family protein